MAHGARPGDRRQLILGVETSCDDTCAALVTDDGEVLSNVVSSQGLAHAPFGGVVPEVASRHHLELIDAVIADALARAGAGLGDVQRVAVTQGPGLIGALLVGVSAAKALAAARGLPLTPVDHLHGHVVASTLQPDPIELPYLVLVASGGHTFLARVDEPASYTVLGQTLDDAAGEAFDKGARLLGLPYPGGPELDRLAQTGNPDSFSFPRAAPGDGLDFSFSGLKTALLYRLRDEPDANRADLAASYQRAIVEALTSRVEQALELEGLDRLALGGGVAANSELRGSCPGDGGNGVRSARGPLHRQRRHDRRGGPFPRARGLPGLPRAGRGRQAVMSRVTLYGKPGCHLCDDARKVVEAVRAGVGFELSEVDITLDPVLANRLGERIPVVEIDGKEAFEYFVDAGELRRRVGMVSS